MAKKEEYSEEETRARFDALMKGAMHKPTPLKDIPKSRVKAKSKKSGSSRRSAS
jgi:hypothetical protein